MHVTEKQIPVTPVQAQAWFADLKTLQLSPRLADEFCFDGCPFFSLGFDNRQDSVRYSVAYAETIPPQHTPQAAIAQWMLKVRSEIEAIEKKATNKK
jgi:hypothetical protein